MHGYDCGRDSLHAAEGDDRLDREPLTDLVVGAVLRVLDELRQHILRPDVGGVVDRRDLLLDRKLKLHQDAERDLVLEQRGIGQRGRLVARALRDVRDVRSHLEADHLLDGRVIRLLVGRVQFRERSWS